jgi:hypothetical protein
MDLLTSMLSSSISLGLLPDFFSQRRFINVHICPRFAIVFPQFAGDRFIDLIE